MTGLLIWKPSNGFIKIPRHINAKVIVRTRHEMPGLLMGKAPITNPDFRPSGTGNLSDELSQSISAESNLLYIVQRLSGQPV